MNYIKFALLNFSVTVHTICWLFLQLIPVFPQMCIQFTSYMHVGQAVCYVMANIGLALRLKSYRGEIGRQADSLAVV